MYFTNRFGSKVNELIKAKIIAIDVNTPNNTVGKKFDKDKNVKLFEKQYIESYLNRKNV